MAVVAMIFRFSWGWVECDDVVMLLCWGEAV